MDFNTRKIMLVISKSGSELAYVIPAKAGTLSNGIDK